MASLSPQLADAAATIERRLGASGLRLEHVVQSFRTGEPGTLRFVPRALFRVILSDPDSGWIVLYDLRQPERAAEAGRDFVAYLQGGLGQTNFPGDAQFALSQLGSTLMFTWWSRERSADPEQARAAFEELRRVGQPFQIVR